MSTCLEKDIHSIYIDNELPQNYIKEYESHLVICSTCRKEYQRLANISELLKSDKNILSLSEDKTNASFERLQTKLHYSKVIQTTKNNQFKNFRLASSIAAVLAFLLIIPFSIIQKSQKNNAYNPSIQIPINRNALEQGLSTVSFSSRKRNTINRIKPNLTYDTGIYSNFIAPRITTNDKPFETIDIFRPKFNNKENIVMKITLTSIGDIQNSTELDIPLDFVSNIMGYNP